MSNVVEVYRVETKSSREGPFCPNKVSKISEHMSKLSNRKLDSLKLPHLDGFPEIPFSYVFGCFSVDQLKPWILLGDSSSDNEKIVSDLKASDYVVSMYLVDESDLIKGDSSSQVAFYPYDALEEGLVDFFDLNVLLG